ncbi:MAG: hypothetical protein O7B99_05860 [Planctomycetota bacterium]|nr:hypothetical protein [Planctomycetota bacterium]
MEEAQEKGRRRGRRLLKVLVVLLAVPVLIGLFGPAALASYLRGRIVDEIEGSLHATVSIEDLSLAWNGKVQVAGIVLQDREGRPLASVAEVSADLNVRAALGGRISFSASVDGVELHLRRDGEGLWNVATLARAKPDEDEAEKERSGSGERKGEKEERELDFRFQLGHALILVHGEEDTLEVAIGPVQAHKPGDAAMVSIEAVASLRTGGGDAGRVRVEGALPLEVPEDLALLSGNLRVAIEEEIDLALLSHVLPVESIEGRLGGDVSLALAPGYALDCRGDLAARDVVVRSTDPEIAPIVLERVGIHAEPREGGQRVELVVDDLLVAVVDAPAGSLANAEIELSADLDRLADMLAEVIGLEEGAFGGRIEASFTAANEEDEIAITGRVVAEALAFGETAIGGEPLEATIRATYAEGNLTAKGHVESPRLLVSSPGLQPIEQRDVRIDFDVAVDPDEETIRIVDAVFTSATAEASASGTVQRGNVELEVQLSTDLERVATDLGAVLHLQTVDVRGRLSSSWEASRSADGFLLAGEVTVAGFELRVPPTEGEEPIVIAEPSVGLRLEIGANPDFTVLDVGLEIETGFLEGVVAGTMDRTVEKETQLQANGTLTYVPDRLGVVLAPWIPGQLSGAEEETCEFHFEGLADDLVATARGEIEVGVGRYENSGFDLGGDLVLRFDEGVFSATGAFTANDGALTLDGSLGGEETSQVVLGLSDVRVNSTLGSMLGHVHPAFAAVEQLDRGELGGLITCDLDVSYDGPLTVETLRGGWEALPKQHFSGEGTFAFQSPVLQGSPFLADLLEVLDIDVEDLQIEPIRLVLSEGRVSYGEPWTWTLGGIETTCGGSIGLDETLALAWKVPVTRELVKKHSFLKVLQGQTLEVPITGTIAKPRLEWKGVLSNLAETTLKKTLEEKLREELEERLGIGGSKAGKDPGELLREADALWRAGRKVEAAKLYKRIRADHKVSLVYALNRDRIKQRAKYKGD